MSKNNKISISLTDVLKKLARRSFLVFLTLFTVSAAVALLIVTGFGKFSAQDPSMISKNGVFGPARADEYRQVFSIIKERRAGNASMPENYSRIFKELTE